MGAKALAKNWLRYGVFDSSRREMTGKTMIASLRAVMLSAFCLMNLAAGITPSSAADYPSRPVHWLIGFAAGGPVDIVARIMSQWLVGPSRLPVHRGKPHRLLRQYRRRRGDQFAPGRLHAVVRRAQQCDLDLALQKTAVRFHSRHRAGREHHAIDQP